MLYLKVFSNYLEQDAPTQFKKKMQEIKTFLTIADQCSNYSEFRAALLDKIIQNVDNGFLKVDYVYQIFNADMLINNTEGFHKLSDDKAIHEFVSWDEFQTMANDMNTPLEIVFDEPSIIINKQKLLTARAIIYYHMRFPQLFLENIEKRLKENKLPGWDDNHKNVDGCVAARVLWNNGFTSLVSNTTKGKAEIEKMSKLKIKESKKRARDSDSDDSDDDECVENYSIKEIKMGNTKIFAFDVSCSKDEIKKKFEKFLNS